MRKTQNKKSITEGGGDHRSDVEGIVEAKTAKDQEMDKQRQDEKRIMDFWEQEDIAKNDILEIKNHWLMANQCIGTGQRSNSW